MKYSIRNYQAGVEAEQAQIGIDVAKKWIWPYAFEEEDLQTLHKQPDFDPETRLYCYLDNQLVGYNYSLVKSVGDDRIKSAYIDFPRMVPGHELAAELLVERALEVLINKGVTRVFGNLTTMCPGDIQLAQKMGFSIFDWGFKVYYSYEMAWGRIEQSSETALEIDPEKDLKQCAEIATRWYDRPADWCYSSLNEWHDRGIITHLGIWDNGILTAACMAAPNVLRPSTAAIYYIYSPDELHLHPLLSKVVNACIQYGTSNVIADLVNDNLKFESTYKEIGFQKVAEWAKWEKSNL